MEKDGYYLENEDNEQETEVEVSGEDVTGILWAGVPLYTVSGTVSGDVVEGVTISIVSDFPPFEDSTTTDENGDYSLVVWNYLTYTITPCLEGYTFAPTDTEVTISGADDTDNDFVSTSLVLSLPFELNWNDGVLPTDDDTYDLLTTATIFDSVTVPPALGGYTPPQTKVLRIRNNGTSERSIGFYYKDILNQGKHISLASGLRIQWIEGNETGNNRRRPYLYLFENDGSNGIVNGFKFEADRATVPDSQYFTRVISGVGLNILPDSKVPSSGGYIDSPTENTYVINSITLPANGSGNFILTMSPDGGSTWYTETVAVAEDWSAWKLDTIMVRQYCYAAAEGPHNITAQVWIGTASDDWPV
jgi:hypothetical protein